MIESLADLLVVSDMDNTLLTAKEGVPSCNRVTIQLFCELGGRFTVATGRPVECVRRWGTWLCPVRPSPAGEASFTTYRRTSPLKSIFCPVRGPRRSSRLS